MLSYILIYFQPPIRDCDFWNLSASAFQKLKIIKPRKSLVSVGGCVCVYVCICEVLGVGLRASAVDASILPQSLASSLRHTSH